MKRRDLIKTIKSLGATFDHEGSSHTIYKNRYGKNLEIPRHREVCEETAKQIVKEAREGR